MFSKDPLTNAVNEGIKRGIRVCIENSCFGSAIILIYSGIDAMASLGMPASQTEVRMGDFIAWCDKYIRFSGKEQLRGEELYGARCAMLHNYGVESKRSRAGRCRKLGYMDRSTPEIRFDAALDSTFALVSIEALSDAFLSAIDKYLVELFADPNRAQIAEKRVRSLMTSVLVDSPSPAG